MKSPWILRRLRAMSPAEVGLRLRNRLNQELWRRRYYSKNGGPEPRLLNFPVKFTTGLSRSVAHLMQEGPATRLRVFADGLLEGRWQTFNILRKDCTPDVDWHWDPRRDVRVTDSAYTYDIRTHGENLPFDVKYAWDLSRHQHTTLLATAYWLTGDERYAREAGDHISAWVQKNPFLHGVHWGSGAELGIRLVSFVWTRRLLDGWPGAANVFEASDEFRVSIYQHQWLLARTMSHGSSANNHLIYEALGLFVATCAMPWFVESARWRQMAAKVLEREFRLQIYDSGLNREMASAYHGFVLEALVVAAIEGDLCGRPLSDATWDIGRRMLSILADLADCRGHPPRQGDGDDARGLLLDAPDFDRWTDLLSFGDLMGLRRAWWPPAGSPTLRSAIWSLLLDTRRKRVGVTAISRQSVVPDAGLAILRSGVGMNEIYCAFDAGPLGFLSIAAHGHADALAIELRYGGHPVLVDSGTYNYAAPSDWRTYFRSTAAHNTVELNGRDQSARGGPFLWTRHAQARLSCFSGLNVAEPLACASGEHHGYASEPIRALHKRRVSLDRGANVLTIDDRIDTSSPTSVRAMFHFHPDVSLELRNGKVHASLMLDGHRLDIQASLPQSLEWTIITGSERPILGWYSPAYDVKIPAPCLVGQGMAEEKAELQTIFYFPGDPSRILDN